MTIIDVLAYVADAAILVTYYLLATRGARYGRALHMANAIGAVPILATEWIAHAYPPMVLTAAFGSIGVAGLIQRRFQ
jgi:hypothetical protein